MTAAADPLRRLEDAARLRAFPGGAEALERVRRYLEAVLRLGRDLNLTAAADLGAAVDVLAVSAFAVCRGWPEGRAPRLAVDLGSGNGFPGVVVALAWPEARVWLVERRAKKARAIDACLAEAGIGNAAAIACDGRELVRERPEAARGVDLVTARAVGTLEEVARIAAPWLAQGGRLLQWKGESLTEGERRAGRASARSVGLVELDEPDLGVPPPGPAHLVVYERPAGRGRSPS
jgi:16S rRNA (guanine527-N7)-methyltransferase